MGHISEYSIVTYERKPGHWRAAFVRKALTGSIVRADTVYSAWSRRWHLSGVASFRPRLRSANPQPSIRDNHPQADGRDSLARGAPRPPRTRERNKDRGNRR